jgi:replicative superfamily II helicase
MKMNTTFEYKEGKVSVEILTTANGYWLQEIIDGATRTPVIRFCSTRGEAIDAARKLIEAEAEGE